jgi:hypothetical protein
MFRCKMLSTAAAFIPVLYMMPCHARTLRYGEQLYAIQYCQAAGFLVPIYSKIKININISHFLNLTGLFAKEFKFISRRSANSNFRLNLFFGLASRQFFSGSWQPGAFSA